MADRGAEAAPTFQQPVAERISVQQSAPPPADGTLARSATNTAVIQVAQAAPQPAPPPATPVVHPTAPQAADESFVKAISAMPPEQQVQAVIAKLKELNPNFDGKETHKIEGGAVTTLAFSTVGVTDISPVKALRWLRTLSMAPPALNQKGSLENIAPLQGMQLTWLWCHNNPITDLSALKGMPLTTLSFGGTQVTELSALTGMKLQVLSLNDTVVSELGPLEGMPLTVLWCNNTKVSDLSPVRAAPLREIKCDFVAERDADVLRGIRTLAKINDLPAAAFWARVGPVAQTAATTGPFSGGVPRATTPPQLTMPTSAPSGLSAKKQIEQFVAKMKELNPEFDGKVTPVVSAGKVVELQFSTEFAVDISPVRMFPNLKKLVCSPSKTSTLSGKLSDLSSLVGLSLTELDCSRNPVSDLKPLIGMKLTVLEIARTGVSDLSPLKGMRLVWLNLDRTPVSDLTPLQGMPLSVLGIGNTKVVDLTPLQGMKLTRLYLWSTNVSDLSPLKGMPFERASCHKTRVTDLTPLKSTSIQSLDCDFDPERDTRILRSIKTLHTINSLAVAEFWKRVAAGESPQAK